MSDRDALIEAMARAMCTADFYDPDDLDLDGLENWKACINAAEAALAAIDAAGVRMVPSEATEGMITAAMTRPRRRFNKTRDMYADFYAWMIAASPYAQKETGGE